MVSHTIQKILRKEKTFFLQCEQYFGPFLDFFLLVNKNSCKICYFDDKLGFFHQKADTTDNLLEKFERIT